MDAEGLMSYGPDVAELYPRAAVGSLVTRRFGTWALCRDLGAGDGPQTVDIAHLERDHLRGAQAAAIGEAHRYSRDRRSVGAGPAAGQRWRTRSEAAGRRACGSFGNLAHRYRSVLRRSPGARRASARRQSAKMPKMPNMYEGELPRNPQAYSAMTVVSRRSKVGLQRPFTQSPNRGFYGFCLVLHTMMIPPTVSWMRPSIVGWSPGRCDETKLVHCSGTVGAARRP